VQTCTRDEPASSLDDGFAGISALRRFKIDRFPVDFGRTEFRLVAFTL